MTDTPHTKPTTSGVEAYYLHDHDHNPVILRTPTDVDALIDALLAQCWKSTPNSEAGRDTDTACAPGTVQ